MVMAVVVRVTGGGEGDGDGDDGRAALQPPRVLPAVAHCLIAAPQQPHSSSAP